MSFLRIKRRRKFNVELIVLSLSDVPLLNAVIFAKARLMECGSFEGYTWHRPVISYKVDFMESEVSSDLLTSTAPVFVAPFSNNKSVNTADEFVDGAVLESSISEGLGTDKGGENPQPFHFQCRISTDERTGELEQCRCKISLRKEDRGSRAPQKLGFVVLNLSEFAVWGGAGIQKSILLEGYSGQRQDNSFVNVHVKMLYQGQDPLFKVPNTLITNNALDEAHLNPMDRKAPSAYSSTNESIVKQNDLPSTCFSEGSSKNSLDSQHAHHFLSHQLNPNYPHCHYDERPISCTNFPSTSNDAVLGGELGGDVMSRASWHGGANATYPGHHSYNYHPYGFNGASNRSHYDDNFSLAGRNTMPNSAVNSAIVGAITGANRTDALRESEVSLRKLASDSRTIGGLPYLHASTSPVLSNLMSGASLADRIQKTRRDASGVIEEVLAENFALLAVDSNNSALSWDGIGGGEGSYEGFSTETENDPHVEDHVELLRYHSPLPLIPINYIRHQSATSDSIINNSDAEILNGKEQTLGESALNVPEQRSQDGVEFVECQNFEVPLNAKNEVKNSRSPRLGKNILNDESLANNMRKFSLKDAV